jgi:hypothetical protein
MKITWSHVADYEMVIYKELIDFTSPLRNFKNIRNAMANMEMNVTIPCVPFTGLYLSDLVFNGEISSKVTEYKLINIHKFRIIASIVRRFRSFQGPSRKYHFDIKPDLYHYLQYLPVLDEKLLNRLSTRIILSKSDLSRKSMKGSKSAQELHSLDKSA